MKQFLFTMVTSKQQTMGGRKQTVWIYRIKRNVPIYCTEVTWNTAGYKGENSCVMNALARNGDIPKRYEDGYYNTSKAKQFVIHRVGF